MNHMSNKECPRYQDEKVECRGSMKRTNLELMAAQAKNNVINDKKNDLVELVNNLVSIAETTNDQDEIQDAKIKLLTAIETL